MPQPFAYIPGRPPPAGGPLSRYLPPIPEGVAAAWLSQVLQPGQWVLDPFGSAPRLAVEAARAGYRVLSAVNNPIARFLFELHAHPPQASELRTALADLAVSQRAGERMEPHIRGLYQTTCAACGNQVEAQAFVWEKGSSAPTARIYTCPACKDSGERPATTQDIERAARFTPGELHRARALERVTPLSDPDRVYAEEALEMYLPRALYVLLTLVNKLEGLALPRRRLLAALLLSAFDQANRLWASPPGRLRPRQLSTSSRYLEKNIWLALEEAVEAWPASLAVWVDPTAEAADLPGTLGFSELEQPGELALTTWPELPPEQGGICLFEGRLKDLADQVNQAGGSDGPDLRSIAVLAALPRPNQAYWTLSALWAGWLWGHEANASFKNVLRRRRYDWNWHAEALHAALRSLAQILVADTPLLGLIGEAEPAFLSTALLSGESAGFRLEGLALRLPENLAQISWRYSRSTAVPAGTADQMSLPDPVDQAAGADHASDARKTARRADAVAQSGSPSPVQAAAQLSQPGNGKNGAENPVQFVQSAVQDYLRQRGEPAAYLFLHAAALQALIDAGRLPEAAPDSPADLLQKTENLLEKAFNTSGRFVHYAADGRTLDSRRAPETGRTSDSGVWWSSSPPPGGKAKHGPDENVEPISLADRVEMEVVRYLQKNPGCTADALDQALCRAYPGLFTPERELVLECLHSYGQTAGAAEGESSGEIGRWSLRAEDAPSTRRAELENMAGLVQRAGERLGYSVAALPLATRPLLTWRLPGPAVSSGPEAQPERPAARRAKQKNAQAVQTPEYWFYITASAVLSTVLLAPAGESVTPATQRFIVLPGSRAHLVAFKLQRDPRLQPAAEHSWRFIKFRHLRRIADDEGLSRTSLPQLLERDPLSNDDPQLSLF